ncbi:hypothetical protein RvY_15665-4 [Ramazzottius varieornatus]|uniref:Uncharacterized protein n=1 Tax=Ramazzottius varieornatus TaxID=947166 RepID=A0A1D1W3L8_RAMVA|nr:hypothetical protein RvY_15665-4 [Ramazzottius varieornatus]
MYSGINASSSRRSLRRTPHHKKHSHAHHVDSRSSLVGLSNKERLLNFCRIFCHCVRRVIFGSSDGYDAEYDDFDVQVVHYKPSNLDELCHLTQYSREEIKLIYRGFKQECPSGVVDEETFKELYGQFYPLGGEWDIGK